MDGAELAVSAGFDLRGVSVRRITDRAETARWDLLMERHHYLGFRGLVGGGVRQVAEAPDGRWLALLGWHAGSFKVGARDRFIGWTREQQFRRLRLVANNTRFLVLPGVEVPNLASRVLGLALRRLSSDMEAQVGHPVLLAETFVDPTRYAGTCYLASNWRVLGKTRGFARVAGGSWREHGSPKTVLVRELSRGARAALRGAEDREEWGLSPKRAEPPGPDRLRSIYEFLCRVPEYRKARGIRHRLPTVLAIAVAAKLAGVRGVVAIGEFASRLTQPRLSAVSAFFSPSLKRYVAPSRSSIHRILTELDPEVVDRAVRGFVDQSRCPHDALAVDGKSADGELMRGRDKERTLVAAIEHESGLAIGQVASSTGGGEIRGARRLLREIDIEGRVVTLDALHAQRKTARLIVGRGGDFVMTVKGNQAALLDDVAAFDWDAGPVRASERVTLDKAHGRLETRRCRAIGLDRVSSEYVGMPHRRQAFRVERERKAPRTGKTTIETVFGVTSLGPERASASELLALNRGHWAIENRLHYVRDFTYDEDRNRVRAKSLRRNLASLANAAISIVRLDGRFPYMPQANRHFAARQGDAMSQVTRRLFPD